MRELEIYQIDAFTENLYSGNPAMVVPLTEWLSDLEMQNIAAENNLSETAFYVKEGKGFHIRWFTPVKEVKLCGHATLASAMVIFMRKEVQGNQINFNCKSGHLSVLREGDQLTLDFPSNELNEIAMPSWVGHIGGSPIKALNAGDDYLLIYASEDEVASLSPNFLELGKIKTRGIICSSTSEKYDFVSRFFAPAAGINEDPVTGSAHTKLAPYWSKELGKKVLNAKQISNRGGEIRCEINEERVKLSGKGVLYLVGKIFV
jgi:PhzF family phenazine biosynthesis protein